MKKSYSLAIVEPSVMVREGLSKIICDFTTQFHPIFKFDSLDHLYSHNWDIPPSVLIINKLLFIGDSDIKKKFDTYAPNCKIIGLKSGLLPNQSTDISEECINLYSKPNEIAVLLRKLIISEQEDHNNNGISEQYDLSEREIEVLVSVAKGKTNKEIAFEYNLSIHTVMSHRKNIAKKTGIKSISGLTVYALINGLIEK
jgi:DNA-binding CsgD family transcriptional regulator